VAVTGVRGGDRNPWPWPVTGIRGRGGDRNPWPWAEAVTVIVAGVGGRRVPAELSLAPEGGGRGRWSFRDGFYSSILSGRPACGAGL
jgi:hypothetical protein